MLGFQPLTLALIIGFIILMIMCFLALIYVLIQNRKLDAKIGELMLTCQSGNPTCHSGHPTCQSGHPACQSGHPTCQSGHPACQSGNSTCQPSHVTSAVVAPSRPPPVKPASYPSFSNYDLAVADPTWVIVQAPTELPSQPNRIYSSVTFPRTRQPCITNLSSLSNSQSHGTLELLARHYETLAKEELRRPAHQNLKDKPQEPEPDRFEELADSPSPLLNRLDLWPHRSRLSSLIRHTHPHMLSGISLASKTSQEFQRNSLTPARAYHPFPSRLSKTPSFRLTRISS